MGHRVSGGEEDVDLLLDPGPGVLEAVHGSGWGGGAVVELSEHGSLGDGELGSGSRHSEDDVVSEDNGGGTGSDDGVGGEGESPVTTEWTFPLESSDMTALAVTTVFPALLWTTPLETLTSLETSLARMVTPKTAARQATVRTDPTTTAAFMLLTEPSTLDSCPLRLDMVDLLSASMVDFGGFLCYV